MAAPASKELSPAPQGVVEVRLRVTSAQKFEWMYCEEGSFEDCMRLREEGGSTDSSLHVYEILRRGKHTEVLIHSASEMMSLVRSLGSNQYSETQPAMFMRLWRKVIQAASKYPMNAADRLEVEQINSRLNRWA